MKNTLKLFSIIFDHVDSGLINEDPNTNCLNGDYDEFASQAWFIV